MKHRIFVLLVILTFGLAGLLVPAGAQTYTVDILSSDFYPELRDSWMYEINNQGVAAGYIATETSHGPYLPTLYRSGGQFQTLGIMSGSVRGLNDSGVAVGAVSNAGSYKPYIYRNGTVEYPTFPATFAFPFAYGVNNAGLVYGSVLDTANGEYRTKVFTVSNGALNIVPLSAPDIFHFDTDRSRLSDTGMLLVTGSSEDYSIFHNYVVDISSGAASQLAVPAGFDLTYVDQVTGSGLIFGEVYTNDYSQMRYGFWNQDGSFRDFFTAPPNTSNILFNNLGQAVALQSNAGIGKHMLLYDGASWNEREVLNLNGYSLGEIDDFNDRGQFVGLAYNPQRTFLWGFVASPVPEPSGVLLFSMGLGSWLAYAGLRRRRASTRRAEAVN